MSERGLKYCGSPLLDMCSVGIGQSSPRKLSLPDVFTSRFTRGIDVPITVAHKKYLGQGRIPFHPGSFAVSISQRVPKCPARTRPCLPSFSWSRYRFDPIDSSKCNPRGRRGSVWASYPGSLSVVDHNLNVISRAMRASTNLFVVYV